MLSIFRRRSIAGLVLDEDEARVVELTGRAGNRTLVTWGRISLPDGVIKEGMIIQPEKAGQALKQLWSDCNIKGRSVVAGVANHGVLVRFAKFPKLPKDKLDHFVKHQAQDYLPIPLSKVVLDYAVIGEKNNEGVRQLEVLLVAAKRDMLDSYLKALSYARLKPLDIEVLPLSLMRYLTKEEIRQAVALVDIGQGMTNILIVDAGIPRLARIIKKSSLFEALDMVTGSLEESKITNEQSPNDDNAGPFSWGDTLANEVRSSIGYYQSQDGASPVAKILISGRGAMIRGLRDKLKELLPVPVEMIDPLNVIKIKTGLKTNMSNPGKEFALCISLATRGLEGELF